MGWTAKLSGVLLLGAIVAWQVEVLSERYAIVLDVQKYYSCLPFDVFIVDRDDQSRVRRGEMVQFKAPEKAVLFTGQFEVVKLVAAVAGDRWRIAGGELFINEQLWGRMHLMSAIGVEDGGLDDTGVVPEGAVYVLGTSPSSYDSRYWGPLAVTQITGKARVLL